MGVNYPNIKSIVILYVLFWGFLVLLGPTRDYNLSYQGGSLYTRNLFLLGPIHARHVFPEPNIYHFESFNINIIEYYLALQWRLWGGNDSVPLGTPLYKWRLSLTKQASCVWDLSPQSSQNHLEMLLLLSKAHGFGEDQRNDSPVHYSQRDVYLVCKYHLPFTQNCQPRERKLPSLGNHIIEKAVSWKEIIVNQPFTNSLSL